MSSSVGQRIKPSRLTNRVEYFVRAGERACVRDRLAFAHFRAAEFDGENRLAFVERLLGDGHELIRSANAFDHQRDDFGVGIIDQKRKIIDEIEAHFVAAGNRVAETDAALGGAFDPVAERAATLKINPTGPFLSSGVAVGKVHKPSPTEYEPMQFGPQITMPVLSHRSRIACARSLPSSSSPSPNPAV